MATSVLKNLEAVLKNFKLQELCDVALQQFPETTWADIQNYIIVHSVPLSKENAIKVIVNTQNHVSKDEIERRISNLLLLAVGKSVKKTWISFELMNNITVANKNILENIKSCIRRTGMLANIHLINYNNNYVLSIEKKIISKRQKIKKQSPVYFQFFMNEPYLFSNRKTIEKKIMNAVVESLGYSNWKLCNLVGPNITDLLTLLKNKKRGTNLTSLLFSQPQPTPIVNITETATEFGQRDEREKYVKQIFGEKPPQLQTLSVTLKDVSWQQVGDFDQMNDTSLNDVKLEFKAPNIAELFKEMIVAGVVSDPIPEYMKAVLYAGKNQMKITYNK